jgi:hypothetical protein
MAAIRVKGHYLEAQYRRLKPRRGHKRALGAVKHSILGTIWHMLATGETYRDLGGDYFTTRDPERQTRRLVKQLERLGHHVTLAEGGRGSLSELSLSGKCSAAPSSYLSCERSVRQGTAAGCLRADPR